MTTSSFAPAVDVYEDEHNVTLKIEVPGIDEKDIDVRIENNTLTVHGERKIEKEEKEENYRRVERQYGSFTRTFTLPTTVDSEKVAANYDKGVLKITLPKKAEAKPKQIKVNVGRAAKRPSKPRAPAKPRKAGCVRCVGRATREPALSEAEGSSRAKLDRSKIDGRRQKLPASRFCCSAGVRAATLVNLKPKLQTLRNWSSPCPSVGTNSP